MNTNETQQKMADNGSRYDGRNATSTHGRVHPWLLTEEERSIETLERLRRIETLLCRIADTTGTEKNIKHGQTEAPPPDPGKSWVRKVLDAARTVG